MNHQKRIARRSFVKAAVGTTVGAFAAPYLVRSSALGLAGAVAPSNRIAIGLIGCGQHGTQWNLPQVFRHADAQVIAVCDVDAARCETARQRVNEHYARALGKNYQACRMYGDFRDLLARQDIDAAMICTPDHWHVILATHAALTGKDVLCEKPLTLTVAEGRVLCDLIKKTNRVFQTASENRSIDSHIRLCELVRNGRIGRLRAIGVTLPGGYESRGANFTQQEVQPVPQGFSYEMWLGPAPWAPYCPARCHGSFRWNLEYSGGRLTDWGAHLIDLAQWANDSELTGPIEVEGKGTFPPIERLFNTATDFDINYRYENGVTLNVSSSVPGIRFEGTDGWISFRGWRGPLEASRPEILESNVAPDEVRLYRPSEIVPRADGGRGGEHRNFLDCVKSRKPCYAPAEIGHRTASIAHIGNIAMLLGRKLKWNPDSECFVDDEQANQMLSRSQRAPWTIHNIPSWIKERA